MPPQMISPGCDRSRRASRQLYRGTIGWTSALGAVALTGAVSLAALPASSQPDDRRVRALVEGSALAGAAALADGVDAVDAATASLTRGGFGSGAKGRESIVVNRPPESGAFAGHADAVEVVLIRAQAVGMADVAIRGVTPTRIRAVAALITVTEPCAGAVAPAPCLAQAADSSRRAPLLVE